MSAFCSRADIITHRCRNVANDAFRTSPVRTLVVWVEFVRYVLFQSNNDKSASGAEMTRSSFAPGLAAATAAGMLFSSIGVINGAAAEPVEITELTSVALTSALDELA